MTSHMFADVYKVMCLQMEDTLWQGLIDQQIKTPMGITAENLAEKYEITRQQCDEFAIRSQTRWQKGNTHKISH